MRVKHTFRLPPALSAQLADYAGRKRMSQAMIVEAALASFLSPDGSERLEAAISRRLDRHTRQLERLEHHVKISNEALALFVRFWLTATPPLPDAALKPPRRPVAIGGIKVLSKLWGGEWRRDKVWRQRFPKNLTKLRKNQRTCR